MISDDDVQKALDHLRFKAGEAGQAKANRIYLEEFRKSIKATIMMRHIELPVSAQEREAYASQEYKTHLEAMKIAIQIDEEFRWKMVAAEAVIESWRTQAANRRAEGKMQ